MNDEDLYDRDENSEEAADEYDYDLDEDALERKLEREYNDRLYDLETRLFCRPDID